MSQAQSKSGTSTQSESGQRDKKGRFAKGNKGGPGNPFARQTAKFRSMLMECTTEERFRNMAESMIEAAENGSVPAAKLVFSYIMGKPETAVHPDRLDFNEWLVMRERRAMHEEKEVISPTPRPEPLLEFSRWIAGELADAQRKQGIFPPPPGVPLDYDPQPEPVGPYTPEEARQFWADVQRELAERKAQREGQSTDAGAKEHAGGTGVSPVRGGVEAQQEASPVRDDAGSSAPGEAPPTLAGRQCHPTATPADRDATLAGRQCHPTPSPNGEIEPGRPSPNGAGANASPSPNGKNGASARAGRPAGEPSPNGADPRRKPSANGSSGRREPSANGSPPPSPNGENRPPAPSTNGSSPDKEDEADYIVKKMQEHILEAIRQRWPHRFE